MTFTRNNEGQTCAFVITTDDAAWQRWRGSLQNAGYVTTKFPGLDDVRDAAVDSPPAFLILDTYVIDGPVDAACQRLRKMPGCGYIPLLLLADDESVDATAEACAADVTAVLKRSTTAEVLAKQIENLADTAKTLSGIRALRSTHANVMRKLPDAFLIAGTDGKFSRYLGGASEDALLSPHRLRGRAIRDVWPEAAAKKVMTGIKRVTKGRTDHTFTIELADSHQRGRYEIRLLMQGRDRVLMIVRKLSDNQAELTVDLDRSDTLTGLTTRDVFMTHFNALIADAKLRERGLAIMCIDIDRFTQINESLGRTVGDAVLKVAAKRIERCLRNYDKLARIENYDNANLARIGGDEFVLLLAEIESRSDVATVAKRVVDSFEEPVSIEGHELSISPSIGIAQYPIDGDNADDLLKNAQVALDEAKIAHVDAHEFFSSTMKFRALKRFDVINELRWAIEKKQLEIHYLPRIDLQSGHVAGLEALLRWIHPLRGSVPLSEVLPLAEASGLMFEIGEWVLQTACRQAQAWLQELGEVPPVSVNLSQQEFSRDDLPNLVAAALEDSGLAPDRLELELTEALLMRSRQSDAMLQSLNEIGVGIVLDDFGQGHSSVSHLNRMPIKAIKIDRAFTDGVREPGQQQAICSAMIAMSRELGFSVIAEGVECELQVQFLRERGCDAVQGFLFTEPLPPGQVPDFLEACRQVADKTEVVDLTTVRKKIASRSFT